MCKTIVETNSRFYRPAAGTLAASGALSSYGLGNAGGLPAMATGINSSGQVFGECAGSPEVRWTTPSFTVGSHARPGNTGPALKARPGPSTPAGKWWRARI